MKKYLALFALITSFSAAVAYATDFKTCYKKCMKMHDDSDKCTFICDDKGDK